MATSHRGEALGARKFAGTLFTAARQRGQRMNGPDR